MTDSKQVLWRKDEKNFEKRVKSVWNRYEGSEWNLFLIARLRHAMWMCCFGTVRVVAAFEADACCVSCDLCQRALDDLIHLLNADVPCWVRRSGSVLFLWGRFAGRFQLFWFMANCLGWILVLSLAELWWWLLDVSTTLTIRFFSTRLETRTKESRTCASVWVINFCAEWK